MAIGLGGAALGAEASPGFAAMAAAPMALHALLATTGFRHDIVEGLLVLAHVVFAGFLGWHVGSVGAAFMIWALAPLLTGMAWREAWTPAALFGAVPFAILPFVPAVEATGAAEATAPYSALSFCAYCVLNAITAVWRQRDQETTDEAQLERLAFLEASMEQVVFRLDTRGIIRDVAGRADRLFGHTRADMIGRPIADYVNETDVDALSAIVAGAAYDDVQESCECAPRLDPDRRLRLVTRLMPRQSPEDPFEVVLTASDSHYPADYTRRLDDAVDRAERAEAQRDDFVSEIGHELRNPLNAVIGFAEMMRHQAFGPLGNNQYQTHVSMIHESGQDMLEMVNDAERSSGIRAGSRSLVIEATEAARLLQEITARFAGRAERKGVRLQLDTPDHALIAQVDRDAVRQILRMATRAAIKDAPAGGRVRIGARREDDRITLMIEDDGPGYPEEEVRRALHDGAHGHVQRFGTEFSECRAIAARLEATLTLESAPGRGTLMRLALPAALENSIEQPRARILERA